MSSGTKKGPLRQLVWLTVFPALVGLVFGLLADLGKEIIRQDYQHLAMQKVVRLSRACQDGSCVFTLQMASWGAIPQMEVRVQQASPSVKILADEVEYERSGALRPQVTRIDYRGQEDAVRGFAVINFREPQEVRYRVQYASNSHRLRTPPLVVTIVSNDQNLVVKTGGRFSLPGWTSLAMVLILLLALLVSTVLALYFRHKCIVLRRQA